VAARACGHGIGSRAAAWGDGLRRLVTIDLPQRLRHTLPKPVTELLVGVIITSALVLLRASLATLPTDSAPFALGFLAVVLATLLGGWRSGLVAMVLGQTLIWYFLLTPQRSFAIESNALGYTLLLATSTQALIVAVLGLYQREVRAGELERARRINFLGHALREMDHRTKNNFQIVTSLLVLQANRSPEAGVKAALKEAAERLQAVAAVYDALAPSSAGLVAVRLQDQLEEICAQIRRGILPEGIVLATDLEPLLVPHEMAVAIGIIVNELVTNACKHAFPDGSGAIKVRACAQGGGALIEVADDGRGFDPAAKGKGGLGTRLVTAFAQRVKGKTEVRSSSEGTVHSIFVPLG
jgi:two-component sensor histidine kinase